MKPWECKKIENCFANTQTYAYLLPFPVTEEILEREKGRGILRLKKNFRRPCYFFDLEDGIRIKGILGDCQMKVSFPDDGWERVKERFERELLGKFC